MENGRTMGLPRKASFSPSKKGGEVSEKITHSSYSRHQIPSDTQNFFSQYHFPSKDISLLPYLPASKNLPEEQIFCRRDPVGVPEISVQKLANCFS